MIRWHDGDLGSPHDALAAVAVRAFLLGVLLGFARGLLRQRGPRPAHPAPRPVPPTASQDPRPWGGTPVEETLDRELMTVGRT